ncbi:3-oxoacyl-[acyl-carrier-protein] synthase III C-terminal domain-containing protein [Streptomyces sp. NBC_01190]|uniref:3-oxoacyl-[acyl-carrier-protein] synthase III C-terminal domain-containing protein n=1 Tax=Streptomyces sp. NBC_01190 TaxID=2903767 RepID=UPI00386634C2|nr:3-oxoacyl-ACP synthase [Streptomyces sp. NBC_01190]
MRLDPPPYIAAATVWLPPGRESARDAVTAGRLDGAAAEQDGYATLAISTEWSGPQMAASAAAKALAEAGCDPATVGLVVHAWTHHQGHDFWSPAHYVAHAVGADRAQPVGVQMMSNGGAIAVEIAATRLAADPAVGRALVTTGDRFADEGFDRWGDYGVAYGDGGTALLLDRHQGPYRLLAAHTVSAPELEVMHRGDDPFTPAPRWSADRIDARRTKKAFLAAGGGPRFEAVSGQSIARALLGALADAGKAPDDPRLRFLVLPRLGRGLFEDHLPGLAGLGLSGAEPLTTMGGHTGHLGGGDPIANLADLHTQGRFGPGDLALLLSVGGGFGWTALLVEAG